MKMKKTLTVLTAFAVTALPVITLVGTDVSAANTTYGDGTATSNGTITFTPNTSPVNPVDPDNDDPYTPDDNPVNPDVEDALKIAYVSSLDFDTNQINTTDHTYPAKQVKMTNNETGEIKYTDPAVTVSDGRGTGAGWKLKVKLGGEFTQTGTNADTLEGAQLTLASTKVYSNKSNEGKTTPVAAQSLTLTTADQPMLTAATNTGLGTWQEEFSANLNVKANTAKEGTYTNTLVWTLADTPA
ncbi:WxL domain-containing protein [Listeria costaricensis]|uniref:WxL domain-containing protein n=1 Tax=Listeria costaricensis TaxID=2026604 RepID=UPI000C06BA37|nr:WxL domain-containing protein [Listeria costaricensis]